MKTKTDYYAALGELYFDVLIRIASEECNPNRCALRLHTLRLVAENIDFLREFIKVEYLFQNQNHEN